MRSTVLNGNRLIYIQDGWNLVVMFGYIFFKNYVNLWYKVIQRNCVNMYYIFKSSKYQIFAD